MCKYCDVKDCMVDPDLDFGEGIESERSRSVFAHVARDLKTGRYYFDVDSIYVARFEITHCPMCGRSLYNGAESMEVEES